MVEANHKSPTASEFSKWTKEMRGTATPEEAARAARHKKQWDDIAPESEEAEQPLSPETPPADNRRTTG